MRWPCWMRWAGSWRRADHRQRHAAGAGAVAWLLLPVRILGGRAQRASLQAVEQALQAEQCVIVFPAGEVSRLSLQGIRDGRWNAVSSVSPAPATRRCCRYGCRRVTRPCSTAPQRVQTCRYRSAGAGDVCPPQAPAAPADRPTDAAGCATGPGAAAAEAVRDALYALGREQQNAELREDVQPWPSR